MKPFYEQSGITLYCGDAREVLPTLADESIDFIFTDPPYGHNNNNNRDLISRREEALGGGKGTSPIENFRPIANDGAEANDLIQWAFGEFNRLLMPVCCCCCCCGGGGPDPQFARWSLWLDEAIGFKQMVVWDKGPIGMGWHYRRSYETILVGEKPGAACRWFDKSQKIENVIRHICKIIPDKTEHPTAKPVELASYFMRLHTQPGHLVLDPFMGHGATIEAAKLNGLRAIGIELSEEYCEATVRRLQQGVLFGATP